MQNQYPLPEWMTHEYVTKKISEEIAEEYSDVKIFIVGNHDEVYKIDEIITEYYHGNPSVSRFATRSPGRTFCGSCKKKSGNPESSDKQSKNQ